MQVSDVWMITLPRIHDPRGNLTFVEGDVHVPFEIRRIYYLYDVPGGETRAGHALKDTHQFLIAASGSFDVNLDDGTAKLRLSLNRSYLGVYVPPYIWRVLDNFSSGAVCLALVSSLYDAKDYFRSYDEYVTARTGA
jgi:hypothetical protein